MLGDSLMDLIETFVHVTGHDFFIFYITKIAKPVKMFVLRMRKFSLNELVSIFSSCSKSIDLLSRDRIIQQGNVIGIR